MSLCVIFLTLFALQTASDALSLYEFEESVLPKYIQKFTINFDKGKFRYSPSSSDNTPSVYGISDLIHSLYLIGQLDAMVVSNASLRQTWISTIHSFQNSTGFYRLQSEENSAGYQVWSHAFDIMLSNVYIHTLIYSHGTQLHIQPHHYML